MTSLESLLTESNWMAKCIRELKEENALLQAQLRIANLKLERRYEAMAHLPALLRVQAG